MVLMEYEPTVEGFPGEVKDCEPLLVARGVPWRTLGVVSLRCELWPADP